MYLFITDEMLYEASVMCVVHDHGNIKITKFFFRLLFKLIKLLNT